MARVTLKDVADRAGVSLATASMVLSGSETGRYSDETAEKVKRIAEDLGYRANRVARGLRRKSTSLLGMLSVEAATTPYAGEMLRAAQETARQFDYDLLFIEVENTLESIQQGIELLEDHQADGILLAHYFHNDIEMPKKSRLPLVIVNSKSLHHDYPAVFPNEYESITQILKLIGDAGHTEVAYITDGNDFPAVRGRRQAFLDAQKTYNWNTNKDLQKLTNGSKVFDGYQATLELMHNNPDITAIVAYNDPLAMGVYEALRELGYSIPRDISVIGFDDLRLISEALRPGLTTVALPHYQMGKVAVENLIARCEASAELPPEEITIIGDLVVRESVAEPRFSKSLTSHSGKANAGGLHSTTKGNT
jgi:LacI family transcriptional regulator